MSQKLSLFCAAVLLFSFAASPALPPASQKAQPEALTADPEFASFGVELPRLPGWRRLPEIRGGMVARWTDEAADVKEPKHILSMSLEPANGRSVEKFVAAQVDEFGGQSAPASVAMSGEKAYWIFGTTVHDSASATLAAAHGRYIYLIDGLADTRQHLPAADMEKLATSMKFVDIGAPSKATNLREEPLALEHFTFKPLATMRPGPDAQPSAEMMVIGTDNYAASQTEFVMSVQSIVLQPNITLDAAGNAFLRKTTDGQAPIPSWGFIRSKPQRAISTPIPSSYDGTPVTMRVGVVQISDREVALLHFTITPSDAAIRATYEKACEDIVRSVQPIGQ